MVRCSVFASSLGEVYYYIEKNRKHRLTLILFSLFLSVCFFPFFTFSFLFSFLLTSFCLCVTMILVFLSSSTSLYRSHHCRHASVLSSNSFIIQERHVFLTIYSCIYYLPTFFLFSGFYTDSLPCGLRLHCFIHVALLYKT